MTRVMTLVFIFSFKMQLLWGTIWTVLWPVKVVDSHISFLVAFLDQGTLVSTFHLIFPKSLLGLVVEPEI